MAPAARNIVILGGAYGGARAAQVLAAGVPEGWRVIVIDKNSHINHAYILPRLAVLPGHEHKAFIPTKNIFDSASPHRFLQAHVISVHREHVVISRSFPEHDIPSTTLPFEYLVYALGSHLPRPLNLWQSSPSDLRMLPQGTPATEESPILYRGMKSDGIAWLKGCQSVIREASSVLVVGGGALGVQFATDIAGLYHDKQVTLVHSRTRLLPRFEHEMHLEILKALELSEVDVILGERLDLKCVSEESVKVNAAGHRVVRTMKGREIAADIILLCTGQAPNTEFLKQMDPSTIDPGTSLARVLRTMQLATTSRQVDEYEIADEMEKLTIQSGSSSTDPETTPYPNIFVIGDCADAFGAIAAGHTAHNQGSVAAENILKLIARSERNPHLEADVLTRYIPGPPAIKVSLGLTKSVYQVNGAVGVKNDGVDDLRAASVWPYFGITVEDESEMYT
ncbi:hypothetical protein C8J56DRAFT_1030584 [Mycena floridula]|nr:hypothetical protein C8J56DRAFT_1030584 [Mycena floridula]